jgi:HrpA-like RNA helicase
MNERDGVSGIDWIVVDEVHERSLDTDVLVGIVRRMLKDNMKARVVLMSATMDGDRFGRYFGEVRMGDESEGQGHQHPQFSNILKFSELTPQPLPPRTSVSAPDD